MVSVHPNPVPCQGLTRFYSYYVGGDPMSTPGMKRTENDSYLQTTSCWNAGPELEDPSKKVRKPYTITKFDHDWKKIEAFVGSKTVIQDACKMLMNVVPEAKEYVLQIRSHAQKYFLKVQKNGTSEHVPPPRPKRKAAHPYPQKAPKNVASQPLGPLSSAALLESRNTMRPESMSVPRNTICSAPLSPWTYNGVPTGCVSHITKDNFGSSCVTKMHNCSSSSNETSPCIWTSNETNRMVKEELDKEKRVTPDFAQVYSFIGSVFDPSASDHLQRFKKMDPMNAETVSFKFQPLNLCFIKELLQYFFNLVVDDHRGS
ncbi:hypothetical protein DH2020_025446 [Rehmannia glutinosa]|uniref:Uncharacterized protein n=1 Tax=Rehmannia glutinosa TaxID=99300 RepID=A0ABR0W2C7_REHGL